MIQFTQMLPIENDVGFNQGSDNISSPLVTTEKYRRRRIFEFVFIDFPLPDIQYGISRHVIDICVYVIP